MLYMKMKINAEEKSFNNVLVGPSSQGYGFSSSHVWMWELDCEESWVPKNWCFWTVVLEKTLESPLDWRSNQSILKEISPGISLEGMMLKLKLQYFGHLMWRVDSLEKVWCWESLGAGGRRDNRGWDGWKASLTRWTWVWVNSGRWWWTGRPGVLQFMGLQRVGYDWVTELNWTEIYKTWMNLIQVPCINRGCVLDQLAKARYKCLPFVWLLYQ